MFVKKILKIMALDRIVTGALLTFSKKAIKTFCTSIIWSMSVQ
jgi:hypothetical protein